MKRLTQIVLILLLPVWASSQTVHVDEDRIVYKAVVDVANGNKDELYDRAKKAIQDNVAKELIEDNREKGKLAAEGKIRLNTPYHIRGVVKYIFEVSVENGSYKYRIDSVYVEQSERGGRKDKISSEQMLKAVDVTGPESIVAERQLNEVDMRFQKLIAMIEADMKKTAVRNSK